MPPIIAYFRRSATVLRVFPNRIMLTRGLLSKCYRDYNPRDIRSIDIDQSFLQRIVGVGDLTISTAATAEGAERIEAIPDPQRVRDSDSGPARQPVTTRDPAQSALFFEFTADREGFGLDVLACPVEPAFWR